MDPSKLRQLAAAHAEGAITRESYRDARRTLVDAITAGELAIERDRAPAPTADEERPSSTRARRAALIAAAAAGVLIAVVATRESSSPDSAPALPELNAPRSQVTPARSLVESFLARREFSADALERFERAWDSLSSTEHARARTARWFASLGDAIGDEIRTQVALAEIGSTAPARERASRLEAFAQHIGVELDAEAGSAARTARVGAAAPNASGARWLEIQDDERITLQLFAVNALDHVLQLMHRYRSLELVVLQADARLPRYRVVHGSFDDVEAAEAAYRALPEDLRRLSGGAIMKSMSALREDLRALALQAPPGALAQPGGYTLQLFATSTPDRAQALVTAFPGLGLERVTVTSSASPHRVLLGRFESVDAARRARETLPPALVQRTGPPLIKQRESMGLR